MSLSRTGRRVAATMTATGVLVLAGAGVASAHVSAHSPDNPVQGGDAEIVFRVPSEEPTAHTVSVQVNFSTTSPLSNANIEPIPGWTARETMMTLPKPVRMNNSDVTEAVKSITWTAPAGGGIGPGQYQDFPIAVEGLPDNTGDLVMPTVQTYDNGTVVNWNQPTVAGKPEPDYPEPDLTLAAATGAATPASVTTLAAPATSDGTARWLGGAGLVLGLVGLGFGVGAFVRRRPSTSDTSTEAATSA
jgi:periplasmic copper chaperone A